MPKKISKNSSILMIGPFPKPIMGMSVSNEVLFEALRNAGYKVGRINTAMYAFDEKPGAFSLGKFFHFLKPNVYLYKIFGADVVYVTPGQTFFGVAKYSLFFWLTRLLGKELVLHIHSNSIRREFESNTGWKKRYMGSMLKKATKAIVLSPSLDHNMKPFLPGNRIYSVVNFVQANCIATEDEVMQKDFSERRIVFLSNLMTQKGILYLLEALEQMEQEGIPYRAKLAGDIDESIRSEIEQLFSRLKHVEYLGVVTGNDKRELLDWANTFVFPSYLTEGLPLSILEAMATGNRIVSTKHLSLEDLFSEGSIEFIEKESASSIKQALEKPLQNHTDIRHKNYKFITSHCTVDRFMDAVLEVIFDEPNKSQHEG